MKTTTDAGRDPVVSLDRPGGSSRERGGTHE